MTKFGGFLGRKAGGENDKLTVLEDADNKGFELDEELFSPTATRLGGDNEAVRNLMVNVEYRMSELDAIKDAFGKLVAPVGKTLRALEEEKNQKIGLQTILNNTRADYSKLHNQFTLSEKKAATLESECIRLREEISTAQQNIRTLESAKAEQAADIAARRVQLVDLQRRAQQDAGELQSTREENRRFGDRLIAADKKIVQIEGDSEAFRQKLVLSERERATLQASLDQSLNESSRISRRLVEADNALASAHARLRQLETGLAEATADRAKLSLAIEEVKERHQNEMNTQRTRFETLQSRANATDKLLDEARVTLISRADEIRSLERRLSEATLTRDTVESKLGQIEGVYSDQGIQIRDLEAERETLLERATSLTRAVQARESALNRAQEKIITMDDRITLLEGELQESRLLAQQQIEDLQNLLQREQLERAMTEGALEAGRKDLARLLREVGTLQGRHVAQDEIRTDAQGYQDAA